MHFASDSALSSMRTFLSVLPLASENSLLPSAFRLSTKSRGWTQSTLLFRSFGTTTVRSSDSSSDSMPRSKTVGKTKESEEAVKGQLFKSLMNYRKKSKSEIRNAFKDVNLASVPWSIRERSIIFNALGYCEYFEEAFDLLQNWPEPPEVSQLHDIVNESAKHGDPTAALQAIDLAAKLDLQVDAQTYFIAISACARGTTQNAHKAMQLYEEMIEKDLTPTYRIFTMLIVACATTNNWNLAQEYFELLSKEVIRYNETHDRRQLDAYRCAITALGFSRKATFAIRFFEKMVEDNYKPDLKTCNSLITVCARTGDWEEANTVFEYMKSIGHKPDIYSFNSLLAASAHSWDAGNAVSILQKMKIYGVTPDLVSYNTCFHCCDLGADAQAASSIFDQMLRSGIRPDIVTINTLINAFGRNGKIDMAVKVFNDYTKDKESSTFLRRDRVTFENLAEAYVCSEQFQNAIDLWRNSYTSRRRAMNAKMLNCLLTACENLAAVDDALSFVEEFQARGLTLHLVSHNHVLNTLLRADNLEDAIRYKDTMLEYGCTPSVYSYTQLMEHSLREEQYSTCISLLKEYLDLRHENSGLSQLEPSSAIFLIAIDALYRQGSHEEVLSFVEDVTRMEDLYSKVVKYLYRVAISSCEQMDDWRLAVDLYDKLVKVDGEGDTEAYNATLRAVARAGEAENALDINGGDWYRNNREEP